MPLFFHRLWYEPCGSYLWWDFQHFMIEGDEVRTENTKTVTITHTCPEEV